MATTISDDRTKRLIDKVFQQSASVHAAFTYLQSVFGNYELMFDPKGVTFDKKILKEITPIWKDFVVWCIESYVKYGDVEFEAVTVTVYDSAGERDTVRIPLKPNSMSGRLTSSKKKLTKEPHKTRKHLETIVLRPPIADDNTPDSIGYRCLLLYNQEIFLINTALRAAEMNSEPIVCMVPQEWANNSTQFHRNVMDSCMMSAGVNVAPVSDTGYTKDELLAMQRAVVQDLQHQADSISYKLATLRRRDPTAGMGLDSSYNASMAEVSANVCKRFQAPIGFNAQSVSQPARPTDLPAIMETYRHQYFMAMGVDMFSQNNKYHYESIPPEFRRYVGCFPEIFVAVNKALAFASEILFKSMAVKEKKPPDCFPLFSLAEPVYDEALYYEEMAASQAGAAGSSSSSSAKKKDAQPTMSKTEMKKRKQEEEEHKRKRIRNKEE